MIELFRVGNRNGNNPIDIAYGNSGTGIRNQKVAAVFKKLSSKLSVYTTFAVYRHDKNN